MLPRISIIIPCYNSAETINEAVNSCFTQDFLDTEFEIIIVDDGSTDNTRKIISELAIKYKNIHVYFHDKNKGGGATRNTAASHASSPVIFCLDSDDILPEGTLSKMLKMLNDENLDGVGIHQSIKFRGKNIEDVELIHTFGYVNTEIPFISLLQINDVYCPLYSTFMITKQAFDAVGGYPEHHGFDTQGMAWRFLRAGFKAKTCESTKYLHRVSFNKSYYLREALAGKANYNWQDVLIEHLDLFTESTKQFILDFDCKDFSKNIFESLKKRDKIFKEDYLNLIGTQRQDNSKYIKNRVYISKNSFRGIVIRIRERIKRNETLYGISSYFIALFQRISKLVSEGNERKRYYEHIDKIIKDKKIVADFTFGGIGDLLAFSTLPRLLKEKYGVEFYISPNTKQVVRKNETYDLCFKMNPYIKGESDDSEHLFNVKFFERDKSIYTFITDKNGKTVLETLEKQFGIKGKGTPELYYKPKVLEEYKNVILLDENTISGKRFGWKFKENAFYNEAVKYMDKSKGDKIVYPDPSKQDLFAYIDMIYSCKRFVGTFSGGASLAACFDKPFSVIWPYNATNGSNYQYCYTKSKGDYVK